MNADITFCVSDKCKKREDCLRSTLNFNKKMKGMGLISMANFYIQDDDCNYFIQKRKNG